MPMNGWRPPAFDRPDNPWPKTLETLIGIQEQVILCRRFAAEVADPEASRILYKLADDLEGQAREVDRKACSPE
jgi:hypothetical protein